MTEYEEYSLIISLITACIALIGLVYAAIQIQAVRRQVEASYKVNEANHDWNRRMAAQSAINEFNQSTVTRTLQVEFNFINLTEAIPLANIEAAFKKHSDLQNELHQFLNFYESIARGVFQKIYDEEVVKTARRTVMVRALKSFDAYIEERRKAYSNAAWAQLDALVAEWSLEEKGKIKRASTHAKSN